jgi:TonB family protein
MNSRGGYVSRSLATDVVPPPPTPGSDQGSGFRARGGTRTSANVVPPPPSVLGGNSNSRIVALGLNPAAGAPPIATGNRRGTFVLSSAGKRGAAGTPEINAGGEGGGSNGESARRSDLPAGLVVKPIPNSASVAQPRTGGARSGDMIADSKPPLRVTTIPRGAVVTTSTPTAEEREVFGDRKFYSMTLNMPNLNSAGGSWVIRFAELKNSTQQGDLIAPEATRKVDPAYPLELMRTQVQGKVTLYAVIRSDGSVGDVRVLTSVDDRLDEYARAALSHWRFHAATKAGSPIDLEAVITIPFQVRSAF